MAVIEREYERDTRFLSPSQGSGPLAVLYSVVRGHLEDFLTAARQFGSGRGLPGRVERAFRAEPADAADASSPVAGGVPDPKGVPAGGHDVPGDDDQAPRRRGPAWYTA